MSKTARSAGKQQAYVHPYVRAWMRALEGLTDPGRMARGYGYFVDGHVTELQVEPGTVRGRVVGTRYRPYEVAIGVSKYPDSEWKAVARIPNVDEDSVEASAPEQVLTQLDRRWESLGLSTFEERLDAGVSVGCSCPDYDAVCKHVVALWHAFGKRLNDDPSALITLFGGSAEDWIRRGIGSGDAGEVYAGPPVIFLPSGAEHNLQDRRIDELVSRFWRPIREIRQPEVTGAATPGFELPIDHASSTSCKHPAAFRHSLERMYEEVRTRAAEICLDIQGASKPVDTDQSNDIE